MNDWKEYLRREIGAWRADCAKLEAERDEWRERAEKAEAERVELLENPMMSSTAEAGE